MTRYGRLLARRAAAWARRVDQRIARTVGPARILIEARTPMNLAVLQPVFAPLLQDPRLDVRFTGADGPDLGRAFAAEGLTPRVVARRSARWLRVDLYINADPWEAVKLRRAARRVNFFHGVAGKYNLDCPASLPLGLARYDRIAFPNAQRLDAYVRSGIVPADRAVLVGYPKVDALAGERISRADAARALGLDPSRPTAIFAPTFSPASALHEAGEAIVETLLATGCNVIAKLHDRSFDADPRYSGGVDWRRQLERFSADPRFLLAPGGDSTPYVLASDLMVSDHSSVAFEFCVLDRPLILFEAPRLAATARINPEKVALLRSAATVAGDESGLAAAVRACLAAPAERSVERRHAASQVFYRPGSAAERAVRLVYELLGLEPVPMPAPAQSRRAWSVK